jgi:predicted Zn finger-like uncharacterized protein
VIVTCERCDTEFQLDDARVPESGARVRCSRCKHAFFVIPPAASRDAVIERAASDALDGDTIPDVTEDLPETPMEIAEPAPSPIERAEGEDSESDWEFNGNLPADPGESSPDLYTVRSPGAPGARREQPEAVDEPQRDFDFGVRSSLVASGPEPQADLGSPVDWDLLGRDTERAAPATAPLRESSPAPAIVESREPAALNDVPLVLRRAGAAVGWLAVAALFGFALVRGLAPAAPAVVAWPEPAPGIALEDVRGRWLDNASLGRLYVVSGRVLNRKADAAPLPRLALELRDAAGRRVGDPIPLRGAGAPEQLREADAAALASLGSDYPGGLAPGVSWDFQVVAWPLPAEAARFAIRAGS